MPLRIFAPMFGGLAVLFLFLGACSTPARTVDHEILTRGNATGLVGSGEQFRVIRSQKELNALYEQLFAGRLPSPSVPEIDFDHSLVAFVAMSRKPTAGYAIELLLPTLKNDTLTIRTIFQTPPEDSLQATVLTRPFVVARINRSPEVETVRFINGSGKTLSRISVE